MSEGRRFGANFFWYAPTSGNNLNPERWDEP